MPFMDKHMGIKAQTRTLLPHGVGLRSKDTINWITYNLGIYWGVDDRVYRFKKDLTADGFFNTPSYPAFGLRNMQACPTQNYLLWCRHDGGAGRLLVEMYDTKEQSVVLTREFVRDANLEYPLGVFTNGDFVVLNHSTGELILHDKKGNVIKQNPLATGVSSDSKAYAHMVVSSKRNIIAILESAPSVRKITLFDRNLNYLHHYQLESWWFDASHRLCDITENGDLVMTHGNYDITTSAVSLIGVDYATKKITGLKSANAMGVAGTWKRYVGTYKNEIYYVLYYNSRNPAEKTLYVADATTLATKRTVKLTDHLRFSVIDVDDKYFYCLYYPFGDGKQARLKVFDKTLDEINTLFIGDNDGSVITFPTGGNQVYYTDSLNGPLHHSKGSWESFGKYW